MSPISARTSLCGIILHPAEHTRSPAMHNAAFAALGIDALYLAFDVPSTALGEAVTGARALGLRQLAVSIPHKERVMEHLDEVDEVARRIGAVNTMTRREGRWVGSNTDWIGAVRALEREQKLEGIRAVVLGAGGAARAVVYGLVQQGAEVFILNRTVSRARQLSEALGGAGAGPLEDLSALPHNVLVNATPVGLQERRSPVPADAIRSGSLVMDTVYDPETTVLLEEAKARGARPISGKWMLVYQAAAQLEIWSGRQAPIDVMARAFDRAG